MSDGFTIHRKRPPKGTHQLSYRELYVKDREERRDAKVKEADDLREMFKDHLASQRAKDELLFQLVRISGNGKFKKQLEQVQQVLALETHNDPEERDEHEDEPA